MKNRIYFVNIYITFFIITQINHSDKIYKEITTLENNLST